MPQKTPFGSGPKKRSLLRKNLPDLLMQLRRLHNEKMKIVLIKNNIFEMLNKLT